MVLKYFSLLSVQCRFPNSDIVQIFITGLEVLAIGSDLVNTKLDVGSKNI